VTSSIGDRGEPKSGRRWLIASRKAATTLGSNCVPAHGLEFAADVDVAERAAVWAVADHGVVAVADGDDPGADGISSPASWSG
jgi:hypothetical protein